MRARSRLRSARRSGRNAKSGNSPTAVKETAGKEKKKKDRKKKAPLNDFVLHCLRLNCSYSIFEISLAAGRALLNFFFAIRNILENQ